MVFIEAYKKLMRTFEAVLPYFAFFLRNQSACSIQFLSGSSKVQFLSGGDTLYQKRYKIHT